MDKQRPFTLRRGQTVGGVARLVHHDLARSLKFARVWGPSGFEGQQVGQDDPLADGDIVELHTYSPHTSVAGVSFSVPRTAHSARMGFALRAVRGQARQGAGR